MFFTLIIPAYNPGQIIKLFNSIIAQHEPDLLVIVCDDRPDDGIKDVTELYDRLLNIKYCHTKDREMHSPGNTRLDALQYVPDDTVYLLFADDDDYFNPDMLPKIKNKLIQEKLPFVAMTNFWATKLKYNSTDIYNTNNYYRIYQPDNGVFLHGNFYRWDFVKENGCTFKENISSHEDGYFNSMCLGELICRDTTITVLDNCYFYNWFRHPTSITELVMNTDNANYIETYLDGYLQCVTEPMAIRFKQHRTHKQQLYDECAKSLLLAYFYIQFSESEGHKDLVEHNKKLYKE